jgi:hypothetical protein
MHHIFFPPWLRILTFEHQPHRRRSDRRHDAILHRLFGKELHRPAGASFRRFGACQGHDLRLMLSGKHRRLAGTRSVVKSAIKTVERKTRTHIDDRSVRRSCLLCDFLVRVSAVRLEENPGTANHARGVMPFACQIIELPLLFFGKMNGKFLHGEQCLIRNYLMEVIVVQG